MDKKCNINDNLVVEDIMIKGRKMDHGKKQNFTQDKRNLVLDKNSKQLVYNYKKQPYQTYREV